MAGQIPLPQPTALSAPFWEAARQGKLVLQRCGACSAYRWTPQILCVRCQAEDFTWTEVSGKGCVHSHTTVHRAPLPAFNAPYVVATVALDEGPLMLTNIVGCAPDEVQIDMPVEVVFQDVGDGMKVYRFRPYKT